MYLFSKLTDCYLVHHFDKDFSLCRVRGFAEYFWKISIYSWLINLLRSKIQKGIMLIFLKKIIFVYLVEQKIAAKTKKCLLI